MVSSRFQSLLSLGVLLVLGGIFALPGSAQPSDPTEAALQEVLVVVDSLRQAGDFQTARDRLQSLRDRYPERIPVLWRLVYTWTDLGQSTDDADHRARYYEEALDVAKASLAADSTSARAHLAMAVAEGRMALDAGTRERIQRSRAIKHHADRAIALDSTLAGAHHTRGRWHREVADLGFFQRTIVRTVYGGLPEASFEEAVRDFQRAIEIDDAIFHHLELGKTYVKMDQPETAQQQFELVLDMPSDDPFASRYKKEARQHLDDLG